MAVTTKTENGEPTAESQAEIAALIRELVSEAQRSFLTERRAEQRYPLCVPIEVIPIGTSHQRPGRKYITATRDVSASGLSFLHSRPVDERFLIVRFPDIGTSVKWIGMEVLRSRQVGSLWDVAGRLVPPERTSAMIG